MLPGGKREPGESAAECARRECREEVGAVLDLDRLRWLGRFVAPAANEIGYVVDSQVFVHPPVVISGPSAEIAAVRWLDRDTDPLPEDLAPMLQFKVLPALAGEASAPAGP